MGIQEKCRKFNIIKIAAHGIYSLSVGGWWASECYAFRGRVWPLGLRYARPTENISSHWSLAYSIR